MQFLSGEHHRTPLMIGQHCFWWLLGDCFTWAIVDWDIYHHMTSLGHSEPNSGLSRSTHVSQLVVSWNKQANLLQYMWFSLLTISATLCGYLYCGVKLTGTRSMVVLNSYMLRGKCQVVGNQYSQLMFTGEYQHFSWKCLVLSNL